MRNKLYFYFKQRFPDALNYPFKTFTIISNICLGKITYLFNRYLFKTYPLIEDCGRCEDCGRNVHDFRMPDKLWEVVYGNDGGLLCYDCFCNRADEIFHFKWRSLLRFRWE